MAAATTKPKTETYEGEREHQSYRLDARLIAIITDIATGVEQGDSGLKSCSMGAVSAKARVERRPRARRRAGNFATYRNAA